MGIEFVCDKCKQKIDINSIDKFSMTFEHLDMGTKRHINIKKPTLCEFCKHEFEGEYEKFLETFLGRE